jgi:hypothetical protein
MKVVKRGWLVLVLCFMAANGRAVILRPLSVAELTRNADLVVNGTVLGKTCVRDTAVRIYTRVELQINDTWKGTLTTNRLTVVYSCEHRG